MKEIIEGDGKGMKELQPLLLTRLKMPQPRKNYIPRNDLFEKLKQISEYSVTLIQGGPAMGKTTLITSFVKEKNITNIRWLSLDENCNHVFAFWRYIIEALGTDLGEDKEELLALYDSNLIKSNVEQLITFLINALHQQEELIIVLDDFHVVTDHFLLETVAFFFKNMPNHIHFILLTRVEPPLYLATLQMEGRLLVIDEYDLTLSREQGERFLQETLGFNVNREMIHTIYNLSEGWIGGLQLVATAMSKDKDDHPFSKINLKSKFVLDYLTKEIYEALDSIEKDFLIKTAMLDYFYQDICSIFISENDFNTIIARLIKKNIMLICVDEDSGVYRHHTILKEYLVRKFLGIEKEKQVQYHLEVANRWKELGDYPQCIEHLLQGENYTEAMTLILKLSEHTSIFSYLERIPKAYLSENPDFAFQRYFYHYANMEFTACKDIYHLLKGHMTEGSTYGAFRYANWIVEVPTNYNMIDIMTMSEIDVLPLQETTKALLLLKNATFLYVQNQYEEALEFIDGAMDYTASCNSSYITFFSLSIKCQVLEDMGELQTCISLYQEMKRILTDHKSLSMLRTSYYIGITGIYLKQMQLKKAEKCLQQAAKYMTNTVLPVERGYTYNLAEYTFILGETGKAIALMNKLMNVDSNQSPVYFAPLLDYTFRSTMYRTQPLQEKFKSAYKKIENPFRRLDNQLLYAKILFHEGKQHVALELTNYILTYTRKHKVKLLLIESSLFKMKLLMEQSKNERDIINLFREAVFYSSEDHIFLPYYKEKEVVSQVVRRYEQHVYPHLNAREKDHYQAILDVCCIHQQDILSDREMDVLWEMVKGSTNKEIADELCISLATVKTHIINIYSKLHVNNRVAAIQTSKKMGLLSD